jgi:hypothetical protein
LADDIKHHLFGANEEDTTFQELAAYDHLESSLDRMLNVWGGFAMERSKHDVEFQQLREEGDGFLFDGA